MARESLQRRLTVPAAVGVVWDQLTDVTTVASWLPILHTVTEVEQLKSYRAVLQDKVGPFALKADLDIVVSELIERSRIAVHAHGEDRQVRSRITIDASIDVDAEGGRTALTLDGTYEITGKVATLGAGTIRSKARKLVDEFCRHAEGALV